MLQRETLMIANIPVQKLHGAVVHVSSILISGFPIAGNSSILPYRQDALQVLKPAVWYKRDVCAGCLGSSFGKNYSIVIFEYSNLLRMPENI